MELRIATRKSPLAMWQAHHVAGLLRSKFADSKISFVSVDTAADKDLTKPISEIGGKGAFATEIQKLVLDGRADLAVHSAKDLQAVTPEGLHLGAFGARSEPRDCLVGSTLEHLVAGATVGTGSNRRRIQLLQLRPDLNVVGLRGNIGTRLNKAESMDAIVMAAVALDRLDIHPAVVDVLSPEQMVPQVGQGALGVECRIEDTEMIEKLNAIDHGPTRIVVEAERRFLQQLGGDCDLPAGAHAVVGENGEITITGILADSSDRFFRDVLSAPASADPGARLAQMLQEKQKLW